jgi:hypothetical protein
MRAYRGHEFKRAVTLAIHKICADLGRNPVEIEWGGTQSASISLRGHLKLANVKDDAVLTKADLMRYVGYGVHELLHWTYTNFDATKKGWTHSQYVAQLHNALEDAFIEHKGIKASLTGNIEELLTALINGVVTESLTEVTDWSNPAQYPFVLAVYARRHATIKVPLAEGLQPIFAEAVKRLNNANDSFDTLDIAMWVFNQLNQIKPPVQPPVNPEPRKGKEKGEKPTDGQPTDGDPVDGDEDGDQDGSGSPSEEPTGGDQGGDAPTPPTNPAKPPVDRRGDPVEARNVEPTTKAPDGAGSGGTYWTGSIKGKEEHVRANNPAVFPINF